MAVGALLPACGGGGNPTSPGNVSSGNTPLSVLSGTVSGRTVSVPVVAGGPLSAVGGTALVTASIQPGSFLVFRASQNAFNVLTAVCTHEACTVEQFNGELFVCPCHNSKYTTAGSVANGPATRALTSFASTFAGDTLTFTA
jgi:cytochrome b6-f complex iron-sulfur subunit